MKKLFLIFTLLIAVVLFTGCSQKMNKDKVKKNYEKDGYTVNEISIMSTDVDQTGLEVTYEVRKNKEVCFVFVFDSIEHASSFTDKNAGILIELTNRVRQENDINVAFNTTNNVIYCGSKAAAKVGGADFPE